MSFQIIGTGRSVPEYVLDNNTLSTMVETSDEWITTRTGIKTRHICTSESLLDLAAGASRQALERAGISADALDLILCTTVQGEYATPSLSCLVQREIGAGCPAFDLNAACTGFLYALDTAAAYLDSGRARNILIVSAEMMSRLIDWSDRATCVLFGDGAGAVVLTSGEGLLACRLAAKGDDRLLAIGGNAGNSPFYKNEAPAPYLHMAGGEVFKFAVTSMCGGVRDALADAGLSIDDVHMVIAHQANMRILKAAQERLGLADEQVASALDHYGNTSSASIPILLSELAESGRIHSGDILVLSAFGGGLTSGACVIKY